MPKYMMLYKGEATDLADMTEEDAGVVAPRWGAWIENVGSALSDVGTPFGAGSSVVDDGDHFYDYRSERLFDRRGR